MSYDLQGMQVFGTYLDEFSVSGTVTLSRVALGGEIHHHVRLDVPIRVYGALRDTVILKHSDIVRVRDINREVA